MPSSACLPDLAADQSWLEPTWVPNSGDFARTGEFPPAIAEPPAEDAPTVPPPAVEVATKSASTTVGSAPAPIQLVGEAEAVQRPSDLLRSRLTAAAWTMFVGLGLFFAWQQLAAEPSPAGLRAGLLVLMVGAVVLLTGRRALAESQLRLIELVLFGAVGVQFVVSQLAWLLQAVAQHDAVSLVWIASLGTLAFAVLMMSYGMFMPNGWRRTALMIAPGAIVPLVMLEALRWWSPFAAEVLSPQRLWESAAILVIVLAIAVYGTSTIATLRHEVRQARKFGQYRLKGRIGQGGMGEVYLAEHRLLKRPCAIKLIRPSQVNDPTSLIRFEREVRTTARLSHWNTIEIYDYGRTDDGTLYYVMEYLPGMNLAELVRRFGPMTPARVIHFMKQTCSALEEAHQAGLIHRDLKPANIFASQRGGIYDVTKLIDFGLVVDDVRPDLLQTADVKRVGPFAGSPLYMAPEQASCESPLDARSDLYSLGATGYFLLTGRPPFEGTSPLRLMIAHAREAVTPPSRWRPGVPDDLERVILRCLEKSPAKRYATAKQLADALNGCRDSHRWTFDSAYRWWQEQVHGDEPACDPLIHDHDHSMVG